MQPNDLIMKQFYKDRAVLVTGGAGFIGSHLVEKLVALGARVTVLDDFSSGSLENLAAIQNSITIVRGSIADTATCMSAVAGNDIVFHLAAFISVPDSIEHPLNCYTTNVQGTLNMLHACREQGVSRFVFSSSAAVYGSTQETCQEDLIPHPESPYGTSKLIGELLCQQFALNYGLQTVCLRYFNVYGERQNPNGAYAAVVAKFKHQLKNNIPITIFGDGLQTRDFIPVEDVAYANLQLGMLDKTHMQGQPYNIATGRSITLIELFEELSREFPVYHHPVTYAPARAGDIKHSQADCSKYRSALAYVATLQQY